jgi:hypothetical protein
MNVHWLSIGEASRLLRLHPRTLLRAEERGRIRFRWTRSGRRVIERQDLYRSEVLTLGHAAVLLRLRYGLLSRAAKAGSLLTRRDLRVIRGEQAWGFRHISWASVHSWAKARGLLRQGRRQTQTPIKGRR